MKKKKVEAASVSLSEGFALSEQHPLSEALSLLSELGESGKMPSMHAPSVPLARPASQLSLLALSAPGSLSQNPLTLA